MKRLSRFTVSLIVACVLLVGPVASAADVKPAGGNTFPGAQISETISTVTGIAISPLLGVGAVGAWHWYRAPEAKRPNLPWYAQPWFWVPALLLVAVCFAKDAMGPAVPTALKKPFDIAEVFENKVSGLIATGAIIPMVITMFDAASRESATIATNDLAAINISTLYGALMVPVALLAYVIVFVVSHAINILILISPFGTVDAALKGFRTLLLGSVVGMSFISSTAGAIWALIIILLCVPLAGWAFRLGLFGHLFAWDMLTFRRKRFMPAPKENRVFLARKTGGVPIRTYGKLVRDAEGRLAFDYRPWFFLPSRRLQLPSGNFAMGRGLFHPGLLIVNGEDTKDVLDLPPRYKTHEEAFGLIYGITEVREVGLRAAWRWLRELFGFRPATA